MSMIGKTLGNFEITSQLGKGGMGEVYQAKDRKLGRDVAIKVLPEEFARDTDRVARFQREAKLLASLNHPNIAAIYWLEESGGTNFLVLELVQGETLADQIKRGPIPVEESLKLALQIAEALEAAHEKGVIHRDLKLANIKVTPDGKVKVLDFGLAKAFAPEQAEANLSNSPTLSNMATQQGVILGTAAYMSPEQARGKTVDKRADVWAFGVVLYEMLTGRSLFAGDDVSQTLARVLERQPDFSVLPSNLHPRIRFLLERCLEKEVKNRYSSISDARVEIHKALADPSGISVQPVTSAEPRRKLHGILPWMLAVFGIVVVGIAVWKLWPPEQQLTLRFEYDLPEGQEFSSGRVLAVSPDGKQFAYSTPKGLYLRPLDEPTSRLIPGTEENTQQPFFSPDGKWIGYFSITDRKLKKIAVNGGTPETLCPVTLLAGASWSADNTIVFGQPPGDIMRIADNGGTPESIVRAKPNILFAYPQILPDGKTVLYTAVSGTNTTIVIQSLKSGEPKELFAGSGAIYLPTGHIVYGLNNNISAIRFDLDRLEVVGGSVTILENVQQGAISNSGTGVYIGLPPALKGAAAPGRTLVWVDHKGIEEQLSAQPNMYRFPKISPDGTQIALSMAASGSRDIWVWDLVRKTLTRLTFEGKENITPIWTPDGKRIAFWSSAREKNVAGIFWKAADGTGQDELLSTFKDRSFFPYCLSSDGKYLIGAETPDLQRFDIGMISMEGEHARKILLNQDYQELQPKISPDARWIAYASNESHKMEIYVRSFPDVTKGRWLVSTSGGDSPLWSPDGRELFYLNGDAVMAVSVKTEPSFVSVGTPTILFKGTYIAAYPDNGTPWDISPKDRRFLMIKPLQSTAAASAAGTVRKINIALNCFEELKKKVPVK
jgi:Tol biopolymer transport system component